MKKFRLLSLVLALLMILTMFAGCSSKDNGDVTNETGAGEETTNNEEIQNSYDELPEGLTAEKIGTIDLNSVNTDGDGGIYYKDESGKYGIMSFDGKKDTGAQYTYCEPIGNYFQVTTSNPSESIAPADLNCIGVVDVNGREIIPMKYASFSRLNERYIRACEVTEQTTNKDEALVYYTDDMFSLTASDDDILFKGKWCIYDMTTGKPLEGITGTNSYQIYAYGNFVKYVTDAEEQITVNHKGEPLPEGARLFDNGCYALVKDNVGGVYDSEHNKLFDYAPDGFTPNSSEGAYIVAAKYENGEAAYVLMDTAGKVVSAEFADRPFVYGDLIHAGKTVCDFEGNAVIEGSFDSVSFEKQLGNAWFLKSDTGYTLIEKDGTVLYQGAEDDTLSIDTYSYFYISKNAGGKSMYYCLADQDFTLDGYAVAPWLVRVSGANSTYGVADTISGETIISGYKQYFCVTVPGSAMYVYAQKADGGLDIYAVQ